MSREVLWERIFRSDSRVSKGAALSASKTRAKTHVGVIGLETSQTVHTVLEQHRGWPPSVALSIPT